MTNRAIITLDPFNNDDDAARLVPFHNRAVQEQLPRRQPITVDDFRTRFDSPSTDLYAFGIEGDDGELIAVGIALHWVDGSNGHLQFLQTLVAPDHRGQGLSKVILRHGLEHAEAEGRTVITADAHATVPAADAFAKAVGADLGMTEVVNEVAVADLDIEMLERWMEEGQGRAPGYELLQWQDGYPESDYASLARLFVIADEDMPFEDADFDPNVETEETVRERMERTAGNVERVTAVVRHTESGEIVGFSELIKLPSDEDTLHTTLTAVHRDHRGHALGKWIKADAILRGVRRYPDATHIVTENAHSNAPMLGINDLIGFKAAHVMLAYQASTDHIRSYLDRK